MGNTKSGTVASPMGKARISKTSALLNQDFGLI